MQALLIAIQFLTRIPVARNLEWRGELVAESVLYYPLVGLLIGLLVWLPGLMQLPAILMSVILLVVWVMISGGLHLDGLADSADAWAGGYGDREKSLRIMKDPAAGPLAVVTIVLVLLLKFSALVVLFEEQLMLQFLMVPVVGRMSVLGLFLSTPYVREQGLGSSMAEYFNRPAAILVLVVSTVLMLMIFPFMSVIVVMLSSMLLLAGLRALMMQRLQGMTGDTIGASIELVETVSLVSLVVMLSLAQ